MSIETDHGYLHCTVSKTRFGPDFGSQDRADSFLAFLGFYPPDWARRRTFTPNRDHDPRLLSNDQLERKVELFELQENSQALDMGGSAGIRPIDLQLRVPLGAFPTGTEFRNSAQSAIRDTVVQIRVEPAIIMTSEQYVGRLDVTADLLIDPEWIEGWTPNAPALVLRARLMTTHAEQSAPGSTFGTSDQTAIFLPGCCKMVEFRRAAFQLKGNSQVFGIIELGHSGPGDMIFAGVAEIAAEARKLQITEEELVGFRSLLDLPDGAEEVEDCEVSDPDVPLDSYSLGELVMVLWNTKWWKARIIATVELGGSDGLDVQIQAGNKPSANDPTILIESPSNIRTRVTV